MSTDNPFDDEISEPIGDSDSLVDYFMSENELTKKMFDLNELMSFQLKHDVQIIRGEDYQYMCYIDKSVYAIGLTPLFALAHGVKVFKEHNN